MVFIFSYFFYFLFDAIGGNVLTKGFCNKKCNVGVIKMTIIKCTYKKQNNIWIQFVAYMKVIWIYLIVDIIPMLRIHILVVTKDDLLTNVQFGEMFFFIDLIFATINYGD
jgi:hypothetical protein